MAKKSLIAKADRSLTQAQVFHAGYPALLEVRPQRRLHARLPLVPYLFPRTGQ